MKTISIYAQKCEQCRLYKDRRDKDGKMMCAACYKEVSVEELKKLCRL